MYSISDTGTQGRVPRTDTCIAVVEGTLPIALARPFVENYSSQGTKVNNNKISSCQININRDDLQETVSMMIKYVKAAFKDRINELGNEWLDDVTRRRSLDKVDAITQMVAYPDNILDNDYVNGISEDVSSNN